MNSTCIFLLQTPESGWFPLFSIQWPQSDQQSYKLASVAVLCCWVQSVTTTILFEWWEQRQPGCRRSKDGNYYCVPAGLRDIASSSSHLSTVPGVINVPIDAQRVKWLTQGHSKWKEAIMNSIWNLPPQTWLRWMVPGQSNSEDHVVTSTAATLPFLVQWPVKIFFPPVTTLNPLPFLNPLHFQFHFRLLRSLSQMLLASGPMLLRIVSFLWNRNITQ